MIRLRDISMAPAHHQEQLLYEAAKLLRISASDIVKLTVVRKSVDARKKSDIHYVYTVDVAIKGSEKKALKACKKASVAPTVRYKPPKQNISSGIRPVVVGFGPGGMFASLILARAGLRPIVLERGADAQTRHERIEAFWKDGILDTTTNVQFGEGGAGTFSDGKLNTGVSDIRSAWILEQLVHFGAQEDILFDAKPHVGTDVLLRVVQNLRNEVIRLGGEVRFCSQVTDILTDGNCISGAEVNKSEIIPCSSLILAIGHSARDTFEMLHGKGVSMEQKPFAVGMRIEHPQAHINRAQYGDSCELLPAADYKLVEHIGERAVYSFCMCPGGYVVAAASEEGGVVTNGMSYASRDGKNANSALLVTVQPTDFDSDHPLAGMYWQRRIEQKAFEMAGKSYKAPAQRLGDFLGNEAGETVEPTYAPGVTWCDLHALYPKFITDAVKEAMGPMDAKLRGFANPDAVLTAPETRSSSPVRIVRNAEKQSVNVKGLYPCGEGAGYAGGIMSAAIDGIYCAEAVIRDLQR